MQKFLPMITTLKSLHIGVGGRGNWPLALATLERGFCPETLCDPNATALAAAREKTGLPEAACFTDLGVALQAAKVDCAIICAPTHLHVPLVKRCIEAGVKSVLVEKGMATCWKEACNLVELVLANEAKVAIAQNYRHKHGARLLRNLIKNASEPQAVGKPFLVTYEELRVRPEPCNLTYPFASVWDMSCHHFDNLISWLGPVKSIQAQAWGPSWSAYEYPNNTTAHIEFCSGSRVHYAHAHDAARYSHKIEVHGEKGAAIWSGSNITVNSRPEKNWGTTQETAFPLENDSGEAGVLEDFHRYVTEGAEPGISARSNLEVMALCEMMVRSVELNRRVSREELG